MEKSPSPIPKKKLKTGGQKFQINGLPKSMPSFSNEIPPSRSRCRSTRFVKRYLPDRVINSNSVENTIQAFQRSNGDTAIPFVEETFDFKSQENMMDKSLPKVTDHQDSITELASENIMDFEEFASINTDMKNEEMKSPVSDDDEVTFELAQSTLLNTDFQNNSSEHTSNNTVTQFHFSPSSECSIYDILPHPTNEHDNEEVPYLAKSEQSENLFEMSRTERLYSVLSSAENKYDLVTKYSKTAPMLKQNMSGFELQNTAFAASENCPPLPGVYDSLVPRETNPVSLELTESLVPRAEEVLTEVIPENATLVIHQEASDPSEPIVWQTLNQASQLTCSTNPENATSAIKISENNVSNNGLITTTVSIKSENVYELAQLASGASNENATVIGANISEPLLSCESSLESIGKGDLKSTTRSVSPRCNCCSNGDELGAFANLIASHLRQLPLNCALICQNAIVQIVINERIKVSASQESPDSPQENRQILTQNAEEEISKDVTQAPSSDDLRSLLSYFNQI